ncbi:MAG: transcription antitermination factor NusB [Alloprevotella sp.]
MINRALIRLKVVQLVYAYYHNEGKATEVALKELDYSLNKSYDLYLTLLAFLIEIRDIAQRKSELRARNSAHASVGGCDAMLAANLFLNQLACNKTILAWQKNQKFTWASEDAFVKRIYTKWMDDEVFAAYADRTNHDYEDDRELVRKLYKNHVVNNEDFTPILEDLSLYWNDDKDIIDSFVLKTIKRFDPENGEEQPLLPAYNTEEDHEFACRLFTTTIERCDELRTMMAEYSKNWDISRMAFMDIIIIQIALAEVIAFPTIPLNVTFNEYIDIAKVYSTPNSYKYVNGMLNNITRHLQETGEIHK